MRGYIIKVNKSVYRWHKMSGYKKHWEFRAAWNSHQIPELHQSWWQSLSEPLAPLPSLCPFSTSVATGWQAGWDDVGLFFPQTLPPHAHGFPKHIHDLVPAPQLLQLSKTTTGCDFSQTKDFSSVWPLSVLILSTPRSGCSVNMELRVTSWSACPVGCTSIFCSAGNSPKAHRILSLFILISFRFPPLPHRFWPLQKIMCSWVDSRRQREREQALLLTL